MATHVELLTGLVNVVIPEVYQKGMSYYEVLTAVVNKVNELIKQSNEYFSEDVKTVMTKILNVWKDDGTLSALIADAILVIGSRTYTEQNYITNGETVTASIDVIDTTVASHLAETTKHRNIYLSENPPTPDVGDNGDIFIVPSKSYSFTPIVKFGDVAAEGYGDGNTGKYHLLGKMLFWSLELRSTALSEGVLTIGNFPVAHALSRPYSAINIGQLQNIIYPSNATSVYLLVVGGNDFGELRFNLDTLDSSISITDEHLRAGSFLMRANGYYFID